MIHRDGGFCLSKKNLGFGSRILVLLGYLKDGRNLSAVKEKLRMELWHFNAVLFCFHMEVFM